MARLTSNGAPLTSELVNAHHRALSLSLSCAGLLRRRNSSTRSALQTSTSIWPRQSKRTLMGCYSVTYCSLARTGVAYQWAISSSLSISSSWRCRSFLPRYSPGCSLLFRASFCLLLDISWCSRCLMRAMVPCSSLPFAQITYSQPLHISFFVPRSSRSLARCCGSTTP